MYGFTTRLNGIRFDQALQQTPEALKAESFCALCDIGVHAAMKDKLGVDMPRHRILGVCTSGAEGGSGCGQAAPAARVRQSGRDLLADTNRVESSHASSQ